MQKGVGIVTNPVIRADGSQEWCVDGKRHREDGPAVIDADGYQAWYVDGKRHRVDGPAIIWPNGTQEWYVDGERHREGGPAIICADGHQSWYIDGVEVLEEDFEEEVRKYKLRTRNNKMTNHILSNGSQEWRINGRLHREDGPAIILADGSQSWWIDGKLHREDGPAVIYPDGRQEWWVDEMEVNEKDFEEAVKLYHCRVILES